MRDSEARVGCEEDLTACSKRGGEELVSTVSALSDWVVRAIADIATLTDSNNCEPTDARFILFSSSDATQIEQYIKNALKERSQLINPNV